MSKKWIPWLNDSGGHLIRQDLEPVLQELFKKNFPSFNHLYKEAEAKAPGQVWHWLDSADSTNSLTIMLEGKFARVIGATGMDVSQLGKVFETFPGWEGSTHPIEDCEKTHG